MRALVWNVPFLLQGALMMVDEFYFHKKRVLPQWEKIGHPIDTFTVMLGIALLIFTAESTNVGGYFFVWAVVSCGVVAKDEWVHQKYCVGTEHFIHAILFVLHPVVLFSCWRLYQLNEWPAIYLQLVLLSCFFVYQVLYWNVVKRNQP